VRALKDEIVSGVHPVGSQLPTEEELCERFSVSRYTVREALRRLREDNLRVLAAGRRHYCRSSTPLRLLRSRGHVDQRPRRLRYWCSLCDRNHRNVVADDKLAARIGVVSSDEWLSVRGFRHTEGSELPVCWTEVYINREFAAVGRLLQRHTGPIFHLIEDLFGQSIVEVHQEIAAALVSPALAGGLKVKAGTTVLEVQRT
jgi:DNA-binding GntR family transcriptional regulator